MKKIVNTLDVSKIHNFSKIFDNIALLVNIEPKRKEVLQEIKTAYAYLASANIKVDSEFLSYAKKLKIIGSPSTGTDHLDLDLIKKKGIQCFDISKEFRLIKKFTATSELAFALMLNLNRKIIQSSQKAKQGIWSREEFQGFQLFGKTLGIIGLGRLGKISAKIGNGFGMKIIANDIKKIIKKNNIKMVSLEKLIKTSDIITIHIHLNKSTENLINYDVLKNMKRSAFLINTSRGKIINEEDLLKALKNKLIRGAGLDVIDGEWLDDSTRKKHKLIAYARNNSNLLITPHIGAATKESIYYSRVFMAKKIAKLIK